MLITFFGQCEALETLVHFEGLDTFSMKVVRTLEGLSRKCHSASEKVNVVEDALSRFFMGSVAHAEDNKK